MRETLFKGRKISSGEWIYGRLIYRYFDGDDRYSIVGDGSEEEIEVGPSSVVGVIIKNYKERWN